MGHNPGRPVRPNPVPVCPSAGGVGVPGVDLRRGSFGFLLTPKPESGKVTYMEPLTDEETDRLAEYDTEVSGPYWFEEYHGNPDKLPDDAGSRTV